MYPNMQWVMGGVCPACNGVGDVCHPVGVSAKEGVCQGGVLQGVVVCSGAVSVQKVVCLPRRDVCPRGLRAQWGV